MWEASEIELHEWYQKQALSTKVTSYDRKSAMLCEDKGGIEG